MDEISNRQAVQILAQQHRDFDRRVQTDNYSTGACQYQEGRVFGDWEPERLAVEHYFLSLRSDGWPVKLAGALASRLWAAMQDYPGAAQIVLVTLENGNRFAMPADAIELVSGYSSGAMVRDFLTVDLRNLKERVARLIETFQSESVSDAAA